MPLGFLEWDPIGTAFNAYFQSKQHSHDLDINKMNINFQREVNDQMIELQREAWGREDNAIQRRLADLKAAGMNPILAAGGAAQASGPMHLNAPSAERSEFRSPYATNQAFESMMRMRDDFATSRMQRKLINAMAEEHTAKADEIRQNIFQRGDSWDLRMEELVNVINTQGENIALLQLQQENLKLRNTHQESDNVIREIQAVIAPELEKANLDARVQEAVRLGIENYVLERDQDMREELGIPSTGSIQEKGIHFLLNLLRTGVEAVKDLAGEKVTATMNRGASSGDRIRRAVQDQDARRRAMYGYTR